MFVAWVRSAFNGQTSPLGVFVIGFPRKSPLGLPDRALLACPENTGELSKRLMELDSLLEGIRRGDRDSEAQLHEWLAPQLLEYTTRRLGVKLK